MPGTKFFVDPMEIAERMGVRVSGRCDLDKGVYGLIKKEEGGAIEIFYDANLSSYQQRFVVAHELGHLAEGHLSDARVLFRDRSESFARDNYDAYEFEANQYAAHLLMPKDKIDFMLYKMGITSISKMAQILRVSETAMTYRLRDLGYIT